MTQETTIIPVRDPSAGPFEGSSKKSNDEKMTKAGEPSTGERIPSSAITGKMSDAGRDGEKLDKTRKNDYRSNRVKAVEMVRDKGAPRMERSKEINYIPRRVFARRRAGKPILTCSQKVNFFVDQCMYILTQQPNAERKVMNRIERRKEFIRVHTRLFMFEISSLTVSALLHPIGAGTVARLVWMLHDILQNRLILTQVIKTCNKMLGWNFEKVEAERWTMWRFHGCCLFYAGLVSQMKGRETEFLPFLRILVRLIRNLLNSGNQQNFACAKKVVKISCEVLVEKMPKEFKAIFSTLEHVIVHINDPQEDTSVFRYMCSRGIHGKICGCGEASRADGEKKEENSSTSKLC